MKLGYTLIYVDDVVKTIEFYENAFGLKRGFVHESNQYGELETGGTKLGFVQHETAESHGFKYEKLNPKSKAPGFEIGLVADDVQTSFDLALKAGAEGVSAPTKKPWGQVVSYVRDCNGLLVEICSAM